MAGTVIGGKKAAQKNTANNPNHYRDIGRVGGSKKVPKGFALMDAAKRSEVSRKGGIAKKTRRVEASQQHTNSKTAESLSSNSTSDPSSVTSTRKTTPQRELSSTSRKQSSSTSRNVKPSRRMSSFLGRFKGTWLG